MYIYVLNYNVQYSHHVKEWDFIINVGTAEMGGGGAGGSTPLPQYFPVLVSCIAPPYFLLHDAPCHRHPNNALHKLSNQIVRISFEITATLLLLPQNKVLFDISLRVPTALQVSKTCALWNVVEMP